MGSGSLRPAGKSLTSATYEHIREYTDRSLENLGVDCLDLQQLHVWSDAWAPDEGWRRAAEDLKREGLIRAFGISVNRWEPANVLAALETGLVDAVQVVYNIYFSPENLAATIPRVERLEPLVPDGMDLPELALRFILHHPAVTTTIPGMRKIRHVERNMAASDGEPLPPRLLEALRAHRWDRRPPGSAVL